MKKGLLIGAGVVALSGALLLLNNKDESKDDVVEISQEEYVEEQAPSKAFVSPPIQGVDIPFQTFTINAAKGGVLNIASGSTIEIPPNSFVDQNGNAMIGDIQLEYREFHDAIDFFVSGIRMTYDSAGTRYQFESAGMMEIKGSKDGNAIAMAPDKQIAVELASNDDSPKYNLYKADVRKNKWACLGKDKVIKAKMEANPKAVGIQKEIDLPVEKTTPYVAIEKKKDEVKVKKEIEVAALPKLEEQPTKPKEVNEENFIFNLEVDPKEFPELDVYKGVLFEVGKENETVDRSLYKTVWDEAVIKPGNKEGENYLLSLSKGSKRYKVVVYPVFEGEDYKAALKDFDNKFAKYEALHTKRLADEKEIEDRYEARLAEYIALQEKLAQEWEAKRRAEFAKLSASNKVKRAFLISSFGIYNCDSPSNYPAGVSCKAELMKSGGDKLMTFDIYLVDDQRNALFSFNKNPINDFSFNPSSSNILWAIENGDIYWLKSEAFADIDSATTNIQLQKVNQLFTSVGDIKAFFKL